MILGIDILIITNCIYDLGRNIISQVLKLLVANNWAAGASSDNAAICKLKNALKTAYSCRCDQKCKNITIYRKKLSKIIY